MRKRVWKTSAIAGVIALSVLCLVLILYNVYHHEEETLLSVCWDRGVAHYVDGAEVNDGSCERPEKLVWPQEQIPLSVAAIDENGHVLGVIEERRQSVDAALLDINLQLGFRMFNPASNLKGASVVVLIGEALDVAGAPEGLLAFTSHHYNDGRLLCSVGISSRVGSLRLEYLAAHHELLHCAGLAHDLDNEQSAVYPLTFDYTSSQLRAARVTDTDRETLKTLYNNEEDDGSQRNQPWTMD